MDDLRSLGPGKGYINVRTHDSQICIRSKVFGERDESGQITIIHLLCHSLANLRPL